MLLTRKQLRRLIIESNQPSPTLNPDVIKSSMPLRSGVIEVYDPELYKAFVIGLKGQYGDEGTTSSGGTGFGQVFESVITKIADKIGLASPVDLNKEAGNNFEYADVAFASNISDTVLYSIKCSSKINVETLDTTTNKLKAAIKKYSILYPNKKIQPGLITGILNELITVAYGGLGLGMYINVFKPNNRVPVFEYNEAQNKITATLPRISDGERYSLDALIGARKTRWKNYFRDKHIKTRLSFIKNVFFDAPVIPETFRVILLPFKPQFAKEELASEDTNMISRLLDIYPSVAQENYNLIGLSREKVSNIKSAFSGVITSKAERDLFTDDPSLIMPAGDKPGMINISDSSQHANFNFEDSSLSGEGLKKRLEASKNTFESLINSVKSKASKTIMSKLSNLGLKLNQIDEVIKAMDDFLSTLSATIGKNGMEAYFLLERRIKKQINNMFTDNPNIDYDVIKRVYDDQDVPEDPSIQSESFRQFGSNILKFGNISRRLISLISYFTTTVLSAIQSGESIFSVVNKIKTITSTIAVINLQEEKIYQKILLEILKHSKK